jgi:hypothetical protein
MREARDRCQKANCTRPVRHGCRDYTPLVNRGSVNRGNFNSRNFQRDMSANRNFFGEPECEREPERLGRRRLLRAGLLRAKLGRRRRRGCGRRGCGGMATGAAASSTYYPPAPPYQYYPNDYGY